MPFLCLNFSSQPGLLIRRRSVSSPDFPAKYRAFSSMAESAKGVLLFLNQVATVRSIRTWHVATVHRPPITAYQVTFWYDLRALRTKAPSSKDSIAVGVTDNLLARPFRIAIPVHICRPEVHWGAVVSAGVPKCKLLWIDRCSVAVTITWLCGALTLRGSVYLMMQFWILVVQLHLWVLWIVHVSLWIRFRHGCRVSRTLKPAELAKLEWW